MIDYNKLQCAFGIHNDTPAIYVLGQDFTNNFEKYLNEEVGIDKDLYHIINVNTIYPPIYIFLFNNDDIYQMIRFQYIQEGRLQHG